MKKGWWKIQYKGLEPDDISLQGISEKVCQGITEGEFYQEENYSEADEISPEDLETSSEYYDKLLSQVHEVNNHDGLVTFKYFKKGDYVRTPMGVGIAYADEPEIDEVEELIHSEIDVQHKFGCSENPSNVIKSVSRHLLILITKEAYEGEKE